VTLTPQSLKTLLLGDVIGGVKRDCVAAEFSSCKFLY